MPPQTKPNTPPPFDQGVFLLHYNRGREAFQEGRYGEARNELEKAQKMRPDDSDVLNLLGLVYFKTSALPEAEVIYRRLAAENPNVFVLHSNLGLILFKLGKPEDAESFLLRAIELRPNYAKSHLYLGMLYREKKKLGLALEHLKFAGADKLVREVEAEMGHGRPEGAAAAVSPAPASPAAQPMPRLTAEVPIPTYRTQETPIDATLPDIRAISQKEAEKAERKDENTQKIRALANATPAAASAPTAPVAPAPPVRAAAPAPMAPPLAPVAPPAPVAAPAAPPAPPVRSDAETRSRAAQKLQQAVDEQVHVEEKRLNLERKIEGASHTFTLHENGFLEINFQKRVHVRRGTVSSYSGNLKFIGESGLVGTTAGSMVKVEGQGRIFLYEKGMKTFLLDLNDEFIYVEGSNLLALEDSLSFRVEPIYDGTYQRKIDTIKIFGKGSLAISTQIEPLTLRVSREYPLLLSSGALVAWTGSIIPMVVEDSQLENVMISADDDSFRIRFEGDGIVVSEQ
ncbi:MAG: tetratricopeptide repeat protein [Thermoanaerobaculia bacterium]|nr:tetratricopeptide repeat protein [Thermoanaerobaculia bacterium]